MNFDFFSSNNIIWHETIWHFQIIVTHFHIYFSVYGFVANTIPLFWDIFYLSSGSVRGLVVLLLQRRSDGAGETEMGHFTVTPQGQLLHSHSGLCKYQLRDCPSVSVSLSLSISLLYNTATTLMRLTGAKNSLKFEFNVHNVEVGHKLL